MVADWILAAGVTVIAAAQVWAACQPWNAARRIRMIAQETPRPRAKRSAESEALASTRTPDAPYEPNPQVRRASMASLRSNLAATMTEEQARERRVIEFNG